VQDGGTPAGAATRRDTVSISGLEEGRIEERERERSEASRRRVS
jgi:hypothetical protein